MTDAELLTELGRLAAAGAPFVLCTVTATSGSCPQVPGAKLAVRTDGTLLGTIGGGAIEKQVIEAALELLAQRGATRLLETHLTRDLGMCCGGSMSLFLERIAPAERLFLFGAGHVHREVAALARHCGFSPVVIDERSEWLTTERFPGCELLLEHPGVAARRLAPGEDDLICVATHDHALDEEVLVGLHKKDSAYVGMIGSRRKAARFAQRLEARGFSPAETRKLRTPMGLEIGAQSPEEIGVSVVAELIEVRRRRRAKQAARREALRIAAGGEPAEAAVEPEPAP